MKGGIFIAQGADTCVYDPPVECKQKPDIPPGDYVSRLVVKNDNEVENQAAVRAALEKLQKDYPDADIISHFNVAVAICEPELKESDLKNKEGNKYCTARQRRIDDIAKGPTYANLITPRQQDDMHKLPVEFNRKNLPALLHAVAYLNSVDIVHSDAHAGNIAKMGDKLVLHDWGRTIVGIESFKQSMTLFISNPRERQAQRQFAAWKFPCELMDKCVLPRSDDAMFGRFMRMYDVISILGSVDIIGNTIYKGNHIIDPVKLKTAVVISENLLFSKIEPKDMMPYVHAVIDSMFSDGPLPAILEPYKPSSPITEPPRPMLTPQMPEPLDHDSQISTTMPSSPPAIRRNIPRLALPPLQLRRPPIGGATAPKKTAKKLCTCIKSVRKTIKARPGISKEKGAIAICVKSVVQTKRRTLKKFKCGKKPRLITQKRQS